MACLARFNISTVIENCMLVFEGIGSLVDVGGGDGTTLRALVKPCPWIILAINFDLPHVVTSSSTDSDDRVEYVRGGMFASIPSADAALLMSVLHNWDDEACVKILKNCRAAIPKETGKVIIVNIVLHEGNINEGNNEYRNARLTFDVAMMTPMSRGKQRNAREWADVLNAAGFTQHNIKQIPSPNYVIVAYP